MSTQTPSTSAPAAEPEPGGNRERQVRSVAALVLVTAAVLGLLAFFATRGGEDDSDATDGVAWAGEALAEPLAKPDIRLTDTSGQEFDLAMSTEGRLTLLMFGYTNCPDVCPISLATLASALQELGPEVAKRVELVFVTADPERDTREVLRSFLDEHSSRFVGLTGTLEQVREAQRVAGLPVAVPATPDEDGEYTVGHATQLIAYQSDGLARIAYPFGTRQEDWIRDLPRLLAGENPTT